MDDVIQLIRTEYRVDSIGQHVPVETAREVFARIDSVSRDEFFTAGRDGFHPEYRAVMFAPDYQGEPIVLYDGKRYGIYRTYRGRNDQLELYLEAKAGV